MASVIIGIHGMGNKPPGPLLESWWKLAMTEGLKLNGFNTLLPEFRLVYWADILHEKPLDESEKNKNSLLFVDEKYTKAPADFHSENHDTRRKLYDFLGSQMNRIFLNEDLTINYSFISDAILKRHFRDLDIYYRENHSLKTGQTRGVNEIIRERLLRTLENHKNDKIMLISHSMGSIIAYDVLTFLSPHIRVDTFITMGSPLGLPFIISRIAAELKQRSGKVNHLSAPTPVIRGWFNFSDILDKVAFNYKLSASFSENSHGVKPVDLLVVNNYISDGGDANPHKSFGYLRTDEFSKLLNDFIKTDELTLGQKIVRKTGQIIHNLKTRKSLKKD